MKISLVFANNWRIVSTSSNVYELYDSNGNLHSIHSTFYEAAVAYFPEIANKYPGITTQLGVLAYESSRIDRRPTAKKQ